MNYTKSTLEKLADSVISMSRDSGSSLVDTVLSVLKKNPMNPEQIRRLVEMTNTSKFLDEFSNTSGDDRFVDFDVLDPEKIIKMFMTGASESTAPVVKSKSKSISITVKKTPEGALVTRTEKNSPGLDTEDSRFFEDVESTKEKVSYFSKVAADSSKMKSVSTKKYDENPALEGDQSTLPDWMQKEIITKKILPDDEKKIKDNLAQKKESASYDCDDIASELSRRFRGVYSRNKHASFELEALANFGVESLPALQAVRQKLSMPLLNASTLTESQLKQASERYLSDKNSEGMQEVGSYIDKVAQYVEASAQLELLESARTKTAAAFLPSLAAVGLGIGATSLTGDAMGTFGYRVNKRVNNIFDRIQARDETAKQVRKETVDYMLDSAKNRLDSMFESREDSQVKADQAGRRALAAKTMLKSNPDLRSAGKENTLMAINMVGKVAPELSTNVPFLTAHVKQMIYNSDGGMPVIDAQSIKSMSEAERAFENLGKFKPA